MILFGICATQAWTYANANADTWAIRVWVAIVLVCNLGQTITVSQIASYYLVKNPDSPGEIDHHGGQAYGSIPLVSVPVGIKQSLSLWMKQWRSSMLARPSEKR
ncbi:hypothetical protein BD779DRAFT_112979 [Infundibulicybe gibba]|nr:hypothetical protein BD779DRAFT_112979 [Infundibulicybe gibba]